jgi:hypothetical protein
MGQCTPFGAAIWRIVCDFVGLLVMVGSAFAEPEALDAEAVVAGE